MANIGEPLRVMLVGEASALTACAEGLRSGEIGGRRGALVIVGVARPPALINNWASLSGMTTPGAMAAQALEEASVAARALAGLLPERVWVQYMASRSWSDALRLASGQDLLIVIGRPRRGRDRRAVGRAARRVPGVLRREPSCVTLATGGSA